MSFELRCFEVNYFQKCKSQKCGAERRLSMTSIKYGKWTSSEGELPATILNKTIYLFLEQVVYDPERHGWP